MRPRSRRCVCRPADKAVPAPTAPQAGAAYCRQEGRSTTKRNEDEKGPARVAGPSRVLPAGPERCELGCGRPGPACHGGACPARLARQHRRAAGLRCSPCRGSCSPWRPCHSHVFEPRYRELLRNCSAGDQRVGIVLISRGSRGRRGRRAQRTRHSWRHRRRRPSCPTVAGFWWWRGSHLFWSTNGSPTTRTRWHSSAT